MPNVYLEAGSQETSITNLFSASGGPAIWDQSGGQFTAYNAGYPAKNYLKPTKVTDLTVEAMRYETRFVDPVAGGVIVPDMTRSVHLVSAFNGAVEFRLPAPGNAEGRALTIKKMDLSGNAVTVTDAAGSGPDGRPFPLGSRYDFVTVVSNGAAWWITAAHMVPGNAGFFEGGTLFEPDLSRNFYLVSAYGGRYRGEAAGAIRHDGGRPDRDDQEIRCQRQRGDRHPERRRRSRRRGHRAEREGARGHRYVQRRRVAHFGPKSMKGRRRNMPECEQEVSADLLSVILPAAARRAIGAYEIFSSISPDGGDAKEFGAFQTACKAAVTHLTALYQLQRLVVAASAPKPGPAHRRRMSMPRSTTAPAPGSPCWTVPILQMRIERWGASLEASETSSFSGTRCRI